MDELIKKIMGFGVPGIILIIAMSLSGYAGAAALTVALASLGPFWYAGWHSIFRGNWIFC